MKRIAFVIFTINFFLTCSSFGQSEKAELPKDLAIRFSSDSRHRADQGHSYSITINRDGTWVFDGYRGFFIGRFTPQQLADANKRRLEKTGTSVPKTPVARLSAIDLRELIGEFRLIGFLDMKDRYSFGQTDPATGQKIACALHLPTETISFTAEGLTKTVENFTGCFTPENDKLTALGKRIRAKLNL